MKLCERHLFYDSSFHFEEKLRSFHDKYVDCFLLVGIAPTGTSLDAIKMTKNPAYSLLYYTRIVGGLNEVAPLISCRSFINGKFSASCVIYYLNNHQDIEDFYMIQQINNWQNTNNSSYQVWKLFKANIFVINDHWL